MWSFYFGVQICVTCLTVLLLRYYASPKLSLLVYCSTGLAWLTSLSIISLVPIDVWATVSQQRNERIGTLWDISYWITFALTWLLIPIHQGYVDAGDFSVRARFWTSIRDNLTFWLIITSLGVVGILLLIFAAHFNAADLPRYGISLSNAFGLLVSVFLLGYGLVAIPKLLWRHASPETSWRVEINRLGRLAERVNDASFELNTVVTAVQATHLQMTRRDPLQKYMEVIYKYAETESPIKPQSTGGINGALDLEAVSVDDLDYGVSIQGLAQLRRRLQRAVSVYTGLSTQYCRKVGRVQELDAICKSRRAMECGPWPGVPRHVWIYKCIIRPYVFRLASIVLAIVSISVICAEATIGAGRNPDLSPLSIIVHLERNHSEVFLQMLVLLPLIYMCACTYYSLFQLGVFSSYYYMVPGHTSAFSLLVNAALMCRFAAPLCYNFLHVIHVDDPSDGHDQATTFAKKMAAMDVIPGLGAGFNTWFPLVMVAYCGSLALAGRTKCCARVSALLPGRLSFNEEKEDDGLSSYGKLLLQQETEAQANGMPIGFAIGLHDGMEQAEHDTRGREFASLGDLS